MIKLKPTVSIIIPFYNRISMVKRALRSVLKQSYDDYEIILINDGSTEKINEIHEIIKINRCIQLIEFKKNIGVSAARNSGIKKASGEYIAFLDSDDEWFNNKLLKQISYMKRFNQMITHTSYIAYDEESLKTNIINSGAVNYKYPFMTFRCRIATPTVIVKKEALKNIWFNEELDFGEDIIFWTTLAKKYGEVRGLNIPLTMVYTNSNSTSNNLAVQKMAFDAIRNKCLGDNVILSLLHKLYIIVRL
jgi:glycosyltransferase involved in cell wall biosynthesis